MARRWHQNQSSSCLVVEILNQRSVLKCCEELSWNSKRKRKLKTQQINFFSLKSVSRHFGKLLLISLGVLLVRHTYSKHRGWTQIPEIFTQSLNMEFKSSYKECLLEWEIKRFLQVHHCSYKYKFLKSDNYVSQD